jgi:uncharacterized protein
MTLAPRDPAIGVYMEWRKLLFMHWPIDVASVRALIPRRLTADTFDGQAYVALVPFTMTGIRWAYTPRIPWISAFHELNVRTYVTLDGEEPGVWFFSLDAARLAAVWAARAAFHLPYYHALIEMELDRERITYSSQRFGGRNGKAFYRGTYGAGDELPRSRPGSLEHFLTERYCLYAATPRGTILRSRIWHAPWPLRRAWVSDFDSDLVETAGLPRQSGEPLLHYADYLSVWSGIPERCRAPLIPSEEGRAV